MTAPVMRDRAEAVLRQEQHLAVPGVRAQRPAVRERDDRALAPVLVVDFRAVSGGDRAHVGTPFAVPAQRPGRPFVNPSSGCWRWFWRGPFGASVTHAASLPLRGARI